MNNNSNEQQVKSIISQVLGVPIDVVEMNMEIGEIPEWDSLHHLMLIKELENFFLIKMDQSDLADCENVADIISMISELRS